MAGLPGVRSRTELQQEPPKPQRDADSTKPLRADGEAVA
jgi:hypothetical protein